MSRDMKEPLVRQPQEIGRRYADRPVPRPGHRRRRRRRRRLVHQQVADAVRRQGQRPPTAIPADGNGGSAPAPLALPGKPGDTVPATDDHRRRQTALRFLQDPARQRGMRSDPASADLNQRRRSSRMPRRRSRKEGALKEPVYLQTGSSRTPPTLTTRKPSWR